MINFQVLFLASFFIYGFHYATMSGNILGFVPVWYFKTLGKNKFFHWIATPFFQCVICMASLWGSVFYWSFTPYEATLKFFIVWPVFIVALAGLNRLLKSFLG